MNQIVLMLVLPLFVVFCGVYVAEETISSETPKEGPQQPPEVPEQHFWNGDFYVGDLLHGVGHGFGTYYYEDGDEFTGEFRNGLKTVGVYTFGDGSRYEGQYMNDQRSGMGVYHFKNGDTYKGQFSGGAMHGMGLYIRRVTTDKPRLCANGEWRGGIRVRGAFRECLDDEL